MFNCDCKYKQLPVLDIDKNIFTTSANIDLQHVSSNHRSFIETRKSNGSRLDPCGTPEADIY